ncbi:recombinase family protein [Paenibacillus thalictri]|uniref:Recombinase family protein n=1 Tax=Paenibacillus thalictri TaxID=2527873 RepID=A0A4V2J430_9BACL|nr:recombinase family protein [Paenibacillus thalictri]TBL77413.1 recombinase family protein [Paenibacillus thalictri]
MENQQQACVNKHRVALYIRSNQAETVPNANSTEIQMINLKAQCQQEGKEIVEIYIDEGVSGTDWGQLHSLNRLLREAKEGKFDEVKVYDLSRISRKSIDLLEVASFLGKHKIALYTIAERLDTTSPMGLFALQMMAAIREFDPTRAEATVLINKWGDGNNA